jgi:hypothetical protein
MMTMYTSMYARYRQAILIVAVLLLSACAVDQSPITTTTTPLAPATPELSDAELLVSYMRSLQTQPATELATTRDIAREAYEREPSIYRRARYLLTLAAQSTSATDDDRILSLTDNAPNSNTAYNTSAREAAAITLVVFIQQQALARKRLRDELATTRSRAATLAAGSQRREDREAELRTLRLRIEDLEKQLAALKSIDRSVTRR